MNESSVHFVTLLGTVREENALIDMFLDVSSDDETKMQDI